MLPKVIKFVPGKVYDGGNGFDIIVVIIGADNGFNKPGRANGVVALEVYNEFRFLRQFGNHFDYAVGTSQAIIRCHYAAHAMSITKVLYALVFGGNYGFTAGKFGSCFVGIFPDANQHFLPGDFGQGLAGKAG